MAVSGQTECSPVVMNRIGDGDIWDGNMPSLPKMFADRDGVSPSLI